jgi:GMP synthase-like glutamine amidotransferase
VSSSLGYGFEYTLSRIG